MIYDSQGIPFPSEPDLDPFQDSEEYPPPVPHGHFSAPSPAAEPHIGSMLGVNKTSHAKDIDVLAEQMAPEILETARAAMAAQEGRCGSEALEMLTYILKSATAMDLLPPASRRAWRRLADVLTAAWQDDKIAPVDFADIPDLDAADVGAVAEFKAIVAVRRAGKQATNPAGQWRTCVSKVARARTRIEALELAAACSSSVPDEDLMQKFRSLTPPTSKAELKNAAYSMTVTEWEAAYRTADATSSPYRISSGYPTMDIAATAKDIHGMDAEPLGSFAPGEFHVFAGATGNGKSAWARPLIRNMMFDLVAGYGFKNAQALYAFTEESASIVFRAAGLGESMRFHHLAGNVTLANVGPSRKKLVHAVWDLVIKAYHKSQGLGIPITEAGLPYVIFWDYIGGTSEPGENVDTTAAQINADLAMRGFAQWDPTAMENFSGESFAAYSGMPWPEGMEFFRPVVIAFAQFRKLNDPVWYDPANRSCNLADFVIEMPDGRPGWPVQLGDFIVPTQSEIRGSGILANHATAIYTLHRSRPQKNPKIQDKVTGRYRLSDTRARIIPTKSRNSTDLTFFPMRFDSQPSGIRGQFYDLMAEHALATGEMKAPDSYREEGDPFLPVRPLRTAFDMVAY